MYSYFIQIHKLIYASSLDFSFRTMAVASLNRKCKWNTAILTYSQVHHYHSLQVGSAKESNATKKVNPIDVSNEYGSFVLKNCQKTPDFKHTEADEGFPIERGKIPLAKSKLIILGREAFATSSSVEDLWETFFADPSKRFDYRKTKRNNKFPDFKHKSTYKTLWIDCNKTPDWVSSKLNALKVFEPSPSMEDLWKSLFIDPSKWLDYRKTKKSNKHPDFVHTHTNEGLWIEDIETSSWITTMLIKLEDNAFAPFPSAEDLWKTYFDDPLKWFDNRKFKKCSKHPDFKHRKSGAALWIEGNKTPAWVLSKLNDTSVSSKLMEALWKSFFDNTSKWIDYRKLKKNCNFPDFKHKQTAKALWINTKQTPTWVLPKLNVIKDKELALPLSMAELWKTFFFDPSKWADYRNIKKSSKCPDFVHIDSTDGLWIDAMETPFRIKLMLNKIPDDSFATAPAENLWITFFNDQSKWFDNRKIKRSNNHPDFKHKDSGEALWIEHHKTPAWVFSQINDLCDKAFAPSQFREYLWKMFFADPSKWSDYRKIKKNSKFPDFKHKGSGRVLWINCESTPAWVLTKLSNLPDEAFASSQQLEDLWMSVFVDQSKWFDYRTIKKSNKCPDFKHRDTAEGLWVGDVETPVWVALMLNNLKNEAFASFPSMEDLWKSLFADPSKWFDYRNRKESHKCPDFKHKYFPEALWIEDKSTPAWVLPHLNNLKSEVFACQDEVLATYEAKWMAFFAKPYKWFDNRTSKKNPNSPDFKHKETEDALWIASKSTPGWVAPKLSKLRADLYSRG